MFINNNHNQNIVGLKSENTQLNYLNVIKLSSKQMRHKLFYPTNQLNEIKIDFAQKIESIINTTNEYKGDTK
jgi:hypothetical protein